MKIQTHDPAISRARRVHRLALLLLATCLMAISFSSSARVFFSVTIAPPPLPIYMQPAMPGDDYLWVPGYWAYGDYGYYWVPGTWVMAPYVGALWTPGYWGWRNGYYIFNGGYWGPRVGFYGGINYGYGYDGRGYRGGYWERGRFYHDQDRDDRDRDHYGESRSYGNADVNRVSYNGGHGGTMARASAEERMASRDRRMGPVDAQQRQMRMASENRSLRASVNHGAPPIAATPRAGNFSGSGVVRARAANMTEDRATNRQANSAWQSAAESRSYNPRNSAQDSPRQVPRSASYVPRDRQASAMTNARREPGSYTTSNDRQAPSARGGGYSPNSNLASPRGQSLRNRADMPADRAVNPAGPSRLNSDMRGQSRRSNVQRSGNTYQAQPPARPQAQPREQQAVRGQVRGDQAGNRGRPERGQERPDRH